MIYLYLPHNLVDFRYPPMTKAVETVKTIKMSKMSKSIVKYVRLWWRALQERRKKLTILNRVSRPEEFSEHGNIFIKK